MSFTKQRLLAFLFPLLLSLPFINRAYFVDDSYFVEIATWLKDNPTKPYDFRTDDAGLQNPGWEDDGLVRMVNPLLHHYYLAGLLKIGGEKEWFLRLGCLFLVCLSGLMIFELARRWTQHPLLATCLVMATPVHWLTAHSLLIDSTLGFFFVGGLYFFLRGAETDSLGFFIVSGLLMGAAILTKYPGVLVLPLTFVWAALSWKKLSRKWMVAVPWILALLFLVGYSVATAYLYGEPHILAASKRMVRVFGWPKILVFFVFFSGVSILPLVAWRLAGRKRALVSGLGVFVLALFFSSKIGGFQFDQSALLGIFLVTSFLFLRQMWVDRQKFIYPRDHFLAFWIVGFILMMFVVMGWVAARYFILVIPALIFMAVRLVEMDQKRNSARILKGALAFMLSFSALLAYADYKQAEPSRLLGRELQKKGFEGGAGHYYMGDSFTMSYLRSDGWIPWFPGTRFHKGDLVLTKEVTMPPIYPWGIGIQVNELARFDYPTRFPIKVMDYRGSAGFYASVWGALPFTFSTGPWERFHLFEVVDVEQEESS